ncbi:hypothetical protein ACP70R_041958 [Stipagrostis hirtigluma subsp. patula]
MHFFNQTEACPQHISSYIRDLTSSYTDKSNESTIVSASVIMFVLTGLFFNLNLFSGISDVSATLNPKVRLFLSSALSLFLPVMSYLFSEAKNSGYLTSPPPSAGGGMAGRGQERPDMPDLSLRAGLILTWMLLVELLRKKVDEIRMQGYSGTIQRAARVIWLGNLVFFNIRSIGRKAVFSILWILGATKLVQRIAFTEAGKRSYAHGKNARVITSYMVQVVQHGHHKHQLCADDVVQAGNVGKKLLKMCEYIVMGEEKLVEKPTANGYKLDKEKITLDTSIVTVGKVWELAEKDELFVSLDKTQQLRRLCLSFSLFKLLRRRFEHVPGMPHEEALDCRDIILKGLYNNGDGTTAEAVFQAMNDEVTFLSEYYHSVVPVVLASPFFLFVNYFLLHIVVLSLCLMTIAICGNGDLINVFNSIGLHSSFGDIIICLMSRSLYSPAAFFSIVDISITGLLFIIFFYEEIWEFFVFLLSNWLLISLLCNYTTKPHWRESRIFSGVLHIIMCLQSKLTDTTLRFKQFSVLNLRWPLNIPLLSIPVFIVRTELVPKSLKQSIIEYLVEHDRGTANYTPLTSGQSALRRNNLHNKLTWACNGVSVAEVILTWHIATSILEVNHAALQSNKEEAAWSRVAIRLSKYCAYLVAFHPELLPDDNPENAELLLEEMKKELKGMLGCRQFYLSSQRARVDKILEHLQIEEAKENTSQREIQEETAGRSDKTRIVMKGAKLGRSLMAEADNGLEGVWKVLADVWTELIIFVAPSSDEDRLKGHEEVLAQGGEFITVLWALMTHIGVSRPADMSTTGVQDAEA